MKVKQTIIFYKYIGGNLVGELRVRVVEEYETDHNKLWVPPDAVRVSDPIEVEFDILDSRNEELAKLEQTKVAVQAEFEAKLNLIDDRINKLLALENKS